MVKQKNTEMVKQLKILKWRDFHQIGFPCWCRCRCRQTLTDIWVCQAVEHQQCAHRLLDRHTILTSSTMIWVTILIIVLHRESWEGFCCFKIFVISVVSFHLFRSSCFLRADDGLPVLQCEIWSKDLCCSMQTIITVSFGCMKSATWGCNCHRSDRQRGSEASVLHRESCFCFWWQVFPSGWQWWDLWKGWGQQGMGEASQGAGYEQRGMVRQVGSYQI